VARKAACRVLFSRLFTVIQKGVYADTLPGPAFPPFPFPGKEVKDLDKDRYIWYKGIRFYVTQKDYSDTMRPRWKEAKRRKVRIKREFSYDWLKGLGFDTEADGPLVHEITEDKQLLDALVSALKKLSADERNLIEAKYYQDKSIREYARQNGMSHAKANRLHNRILKKLQNLLENYF
jgi:RNA polymerase sigma factor (sigma-70 family)